jgi:hypothetical protein
LCPRKGNRGTGRNGEGNKGNKELWERRNRGTDRRREKGKKKIVE